MIRWRIVLGDKTLVVEAVFFITRRVTSWRKELYEVNEQDVSRLFSQTSGEHSREVTVDDLAFTIRELISDPRNDSTNDTDENNSTDENELRNVFFIAKNDASGDPELYQMKEEDVAKISNLILQLREEAEKVPASDLLLLINALAGDSQASSNFSNEVPNQPDMDYSSRYQDPSNPNIEPNSMNPRMYDEERYSNNRNEEYIPRSETMENGYGGGERFNTDTFNEPPNYGNDMQDSMRNNIPLKQEQMKNEVEEEEDGEWEQIEEIEEEEEEDNQYNMNPPYPGNQVNREPEYNRQAQYNNSNRVGYNDGAMYPSPMDRMPGDMELSRQPRRNFPDGPNYGPKANNMPMKTNDVNDEAKNGMDNSEVLLCFLCNFKTAEPEALKQHYSSKHGDNPEDNNSAPTNNEPASKDQEMDEDLPAASRFDGEGYPCNQCPYKPNNKRFLVRHIKEVHEKVKDFACQMCPYKTARNYDLKAHMDKVHTNNGQDFADPRNGSEDHEELKVTGTSCPKCEYVAGNNNRLMRHIKGVHDQIRDNACTFPNCDYKTSYKFQLSRHMQKHHGEDTGTNGPDNRAPMMNYQAQMPRPPPMQGNFNNNNFKRLDDSRSPMTRGDMSMPPRNYFSSEPIPRDQLDEPFFPVKQEEGQFNNRFKQEIKSEFKQEQMNDYERQMEEEKYEPPIMKNCLYCTYKNESRFNMHEHVKIFHGKNLSITCTKCRYQTWNKSYLDRHVLTVHANNKHLSCLHCNYTTYTYPSLQIHSLTRHIRPIYVKSKPMTCSQCFYQTMSLTSLKGHLKSHEEKQSHKCKTCEYKCSDPILLKKHVKISHAEIETLLCFLCNFKTSGKMLLAEHYIMQHGPPPSKVISPHISKRQQYDYERRNFPDQSAPMRDMDGDGGDGQRFPCNMCSYNPARRSYLLRHQREVHEGVKAFSCTLCDYKTARNRDLQTHLRTKHGGESLLGEGFMCSMCSFKSTDEQALVQHRNEVHGVLKGVACDQCDYVAGNPGRLQLHIKGVHDQNRDQVCDFPKCDYKTSYKSGLVRHFKTVHSIDGQEAIDRANRLDVMHNGPPGLSDIQLQAQLMAKPVNVHGPSIPKQETPRPPPEIPMPSNSPSFMNREGNNGPEFDEPRDFPRQQPMFEQAPGTFPEMEERNIPRPMDGQFYDNNIMNRNNEDMKPIIPPPTSREIYLPPGFNQHGLKQDDVDYSMPAAHNMEDEQMPYQQQPFIENEQVQNSYMHNPPYIPTQQ